MKMIGRIPVTGSLRISKSNGRGTVTRGGSEPLFNRVRNLCDTSETVRSDGGPVSQWKYVYQIAKYTSCTVRS